MSSEQTPDDGPGAGDAGTRRRLPGVTAAAVAVAVMLAGGGVAYVAAGTGDDDASSGSRAHAADQARDDDPPKLKLDGYGPGVPLKAVGALPKGPGSAPVYAPEADVPKADVARLAKALGVKGSVRQQHHEWLVGVTKDGQGPQLRVQRDAPGVWTYQRYARSVGGPPCTVRPLRPGAGARDEAASSDRPGGPGPKCPLYGRGSSVPSATGSAGSGSADSGGAPAGTGSGPADSGVDPVSPSAAKAAAAPVLKALGESGAAVDTGSVSGAMRIVTADPVVGGLPTSGWRTSLTVGSDKQLVGGTGRLSPPAEGDRYPVVTAAQAVKSAGSYALKHGPACASPMPYGKDGAAESGAGKDGAAKNSAGKDSTGKDSTTKNSTTKVPPCTPAGHRPHPLAVRKATFGLSLQSVDGRQALVPSWLFKVDSPRESFAPEQWALAYPAVDPDFLVRPTAPGPAPEPPSTSRPGSPAPSMPAPGKQTLRVESYTASGPALKVRFWGGVCSTYTASAKETDGAVHVRVTGKDKKPGRVCVKVARLFERTVTLSHPLDGRKVVDASSGAAVARK